MTNLSSLKVSLTKHGADKVATLLKDLPTSKVLKNTSNTHQKIKIDRVQAAKNLSAYGKKQKIPCFWDEAKSLGSDAIDALVLCAIIYSHHDLIRAMSNSSTERYKGTVKRGVHLNGKSYTNFAHSLTQLGFVESEKSNSVSYDLKGIFHIEGLQNIFLELIASKLTAAGWDGKADVLDEVLRLELHKPLSVSKSFLSAWIEEGRVPPSMDTSKDMEFFFSETADSDNRVESFSFTPGHNHKKEGKTGTSGTTASDISLDHNRIQNKSFELLSAKYGEVNVSCEQATGTGKFIDIVVKDKEGFTFYEIKTAATAGSCIRQAISQLLEYAFWPDRHLASKLVVLAEADLEPNNRSYLKHLRETFNIPIEYHQLKGGKIIEHL